ncbi:hypothetical protein G6F22_016422 [Rhizopus arrhizus]|nr:hypothetical protein G6F22_016422 [Rhizopus arrhizus]
MRVGAAETQLGHGVRHREHQEGIDQGDLGDLAADAQQERFAVCAQQFAQRHLVGEWLPGLRALALDLLELGRFIDAVADEQAHDDEHGAGEERQAPAPGQEVCFRQPRHQREGAHRQQDAQGRTHQRQAAEERLPLRRRMFDCHQHGATHLAAERQALADAQHDQQHRRRDADLFIRGQQPDEHGAQAHQQQAQRQHGFAADAVAEVAEQDAADGPRQHAAGECAKGRQRAAPRRCRRRGSRRLPRRCR